MSTKLSQAVLASFTDLPSSQLIELCARVMETSEQYEERYNVSVALMHQGHFGVAAEYFHKLWMAFNDEKSFVNLVLCRLRNADRFPIEKILSFLGNNSIGMEAFEKLASIILRNYVIGDAIRFLNFVELTPKRALPLARLLATVIKLNADLAPWSKASVEALTRARRLTLEIYLLVASDRHDEAISVFEQNAEIIDLEAVFPLLLFSYRSKARDHDIIERFAGLKINSLPLDIIFEVAQAYLRTGSVNNSARLYRYLLAATPRKIEYLYNYLAFFDDFDLRSATTYFGNLGGSSEHSWMHAFCGFKIAEISGDYKAAFEALQRSNELLLREKKIRGERSDIGLSQSLRLIHGWLRNLPVQTSTHDGFLPVFIIGMPRTGTSLIDRVLASYPGAMSVGESVVMNELIVGREFSKPKIEDQIREIRRGYLENLPDVAGRSIVLDKMPHNFRWAEIIQAAFPEAKFVILHRDAQDVAWSLFSNQFVSGHIYSHNFQDICEYIDFYLSHMSSLELKSVIHVSYDRFVSEWPKSGYALLDALGLPKSSAIVDFQSVAGRTQTASSAQVTKKVSLRRQPKWQKYQDFLPQCFHQLSGRHT